ncbi:hypothetical protein FHL15_001895 [Xylaria flabelliformis]|uniref:Uncharacterized protein n=1 Tax=Xylaria flabelliformis TaxID=2512241 RepID=A0A553IA71_9PEZI|nr:hypothetical protein FHL15_001895 [Xylaria flabelliformis]
MAQNYICHRRDIWSGKIGDVYIKWNVPAKKKLARYARQQGEDPSVLKEASEHMAFQLARRLDCKRAVIKSPPHEVNIPCAYLDTNKKLCMSGAFSSYRTTVRQARIFLDSKSALKRYDGLEVVGEAVLTTFGPSRAVALNLDYSWGVGVLAWTGPTIRRGRPSYYLDAQSGMATSEANSIPESATPEASSVPEGATPTAGPHRMDPKAIEFRPSRELNIQPQTCNYLGPNVGGIDDAFVHQFPMNIYPDGSPAYPEMLLPPGGYYHTQISSYVPLVQPMAPQPWVCYPQEQKWYYNFGTQRWEWVGFPPYVLGYA